MWQTLRWSSGEAVHSQEEPNARIGPVLSHHRRVQGDLLSAVIFNAVIIVALVPLALRGVAYRAMSAEALLRRNLLIYGVGGVIVPFIGIKIIDVIITTLRLA